MSSDYEKLSHHPFGRCIEIRKLVVLLNNITNKYDNNYIVVCKLLQHNDVEISLVPVIEEVYNYHVEQTGQRAVFILHIDDVAATCSINGIDLGPDGIEEDKMFMYPTIKSNHEKLREGTVGIRIRSNNNDWNKVVTTIEKIFEEDE